MNSSSFDLSNFLPNINFNFSFINNIFKKVSPGQMMTWAVSLILVVVMIIAIITILDVINEKKKQEKIFGRGKESQIKQSFLKKMKFFKQYHRNLEIVLTEKGKESLTDTLFYITVTFLAFLVVYFITVHQILLAVVAPIALAKAINRIVVLLGTNVMEKVEEQLPFAIDNIIRISSKYGDLKNIMYEASRTVDNPLRNILEQLSRKMISGNTEQVLMEFAQEYDNVWIYSLVFTLLSYVQDANKENTIKNLKHLRNILEKENNLKKASVTDKRYGVMVNYALAFFAGIAGIGNILFNPVGKDFFFSSFTGIICFVLGYGCVLLTIMINITMSKSKSKGGK